MGVADDKVEPEDEPEVIEVVDFEREGQDERSSLMAMS
jgi:hypothetical protein